MSINYIYNVISDLQCSLSSIYRVSSQRFTALPNIDFSVPLQNIYRVSWYTFTISSYSFYTFLSWHSTSSTYYLFTMSPRSIALASLNIFLWCFLTVFCTVNLHCFTSVIKESFTISQLFFFYLSEVYPLGHIYSLLKFWFYRVLFQRFTVFYRAPLSVSESAPVIFVKERDRQGRVSINQ